MKKNIAVILVLLVNIFIAYTITTFFGIQNIILFQSMTSMNYTITYEIIIWFSLFFIEYAIYKFIIYKIINDN